MAESFPPRTVSLPEMIIDQTDRRFRKAIYRFVEAASRLGDCREGFAREMGLTGSQYLVIMSVAYQQEEEGVGIASIATDIGLAATHATTEVGRLVRKGLLDKRPNPHDGRAVLVRLTKEGRREVEMVTQTVRVVNDILFQDISGDELKVLVSISERLIRNSERALAELRVVRHAKSASETGGLE